jgi:hypothetical protein
MTSAPLSVHLTDRVETAYIGLDLLARLNYNNKNTALRCPPVFTASIQAHEAEFRIRGTLHQHAGTNAALLCAMRQISTSGVHAESRITDAALLGVRLLPARCSRRQHD